MTCRAVLLALAAASFICGYSHFSDYVVRQGRFISDLMPVAVYGTLLIFLLVVNPLLRRLRASWALTAKELAVVVAASLLACAIPSYGVIEALPTSIMLPFHYEQTTPGWAQRQVTGIVPKRMLPDIAGDEERVLKGYVMGMAEGDRHIGFGDIPWKAWAGALGFWLPLILSMAVASLALAVVLHRQWSRHEQLPYPISRVTEALLPSADGKAGTVLRNRLFWIGFCIVFGILLNNYLCRWWPDLLIPVRLHLDFTAFSELTPTLVRGNGLRLLRPSILFSVVGLAFFLASDVSFSMAAGPFIFCYVAGILASYGIVLRTGHHQSVKIEAFLFAGGYTGIVLMALYTGRHYYWNVLKRSFGARAGHEVEPHAAWAMRVFLVGTAAFALQLVLVGLDWQLALAYTALILIILVAVSRTIAETGAFYIGTEVFPGAILWGFLGTVALGPPTMVIMFLVTVILVVGPGWAPMPFFVQALKLTDDVAVPVRRTAGLGLAVLFLGVAIALPLILYWQYDRGALLASGSWPRYAATFPFENMVQVTHLLEAQDTRELAESLRGWQRLAHVSPHWPAVTAFAIAVGLSIGIATARLRFTWWPFHPVMFVFLGGAQALHMSGSFALGWLIKTLVGKYGGEKVYQRVKPLMIGIIAGDMLGRFAPMLIGSIYYAVTGRSP